LPRISIYNLRIPLQPAQAVLETFSKELIGLFCCFVPASNYRDDLAPTFVATYIRLDLYGMPGTEYVSMTTARQHLKSLQLMI